MFASRILPLTLLVVTLVFSGCNFLSPYQITVTTPDEAVVNPAVDTLDVAVTPEAYVYLSGVQCGNEAEDELLPVVADDSDRKSAHNLSLAILDGKEAGTRCDLTITAFDQATTSTSTKETSVYVLEKSEDLSGDEMSIDETTDETGEEVADPTPDTVGVSVVGEVCGGEFGISCAVGLFCLTEDGSEPDAEGVCTAPPSDELPVDETVEEDPVIEEPVLESPEDDSADQESTEELVDTDLGEDALSCADNGGTWNECGSACDDDAEFCTLQCVPQCEYPEQ